MSDFSEAFNALPYAERVMLGAMLTEAEIRIIEAEKNRLRGEFYKTIAAHNARIKAMREHLNKIGKVAHPAEPTEPKGVSDESHDSHK